MIIVLSPAKTVDFDLRPSVKTCTVPEFLDEARKLVRLMRCYSIDELRELLGISADLAALNHRRFASWKTPFTLANAKQAVLAFQGDVYAGLAAGTFNARDRAFAQRRLCVLSGLYGVLRPLDLIQAYRLEMGSRLPDLPGGSLYGFWGEKPTRTLNERARTVKAKHLVNLASNEYFKVIRPDLLEPEVCTPVFKDLKNGKYQIIGFFAKKARGMMANFIIRNRIRAIDDLKDFHMGGYRFDAGMSSASTLVYTRDTEAEAA